MWSKREGGKQISGNFLNGEVNDFLQRARRGDVLFILLSGHGVHASGRDYLIPEDIHDNTYPFVSGCVAIDWATQLDQTLADHIVILIDACREGIDQDVMGVAAVRQWGRQKTQAALRRKVAYVYACSPGQYSLFVGSHEPVATGLECGTSQGESFSLFSRAVSDTVVSFTHSLSLGEFRDRVQDRVTELHRAYQKKGDPQLLRVVTDIATDDFTVLPATIAGFKAQPMTTPPHAVIAPRVLSPTPPDPLVLPVPPVPPTPPIGTPTHGALPQPYRKRPVTYSAVAGALIALIALGLYEGYQWTQSLYYVGTKDNDHVAVYRGLSQDLAGVSLSSLYDDHPEIELKYLPADQRLRVKDMIAVDSRDQALQKAKELGMQATACKKIAEHRTLTEEEQKLAVQCSSAEP